MKQEKGNKEQELQAALLFLGLDLLRSALGDLKRIADAQETLAYNANHRLSDGR